LCELKNKVAELADSNERKGIRTSLNEIKEILTKKILNRPSKVPFE